jgi:hypothetical protein
MRHWGGGFLTSAQGAPRLRVLSPSKHQHRRRAAHQHSAWPPLDRLGSRPQVRVPTPHCCHACGASFPASLPSHRPRQLLTAQPYRKTQRRPELAPASCAPAARPARMPVAGKNAHPTTSSHTHRSFPVCGRHSCRAGLSTTRRSGWHDPARLRQPAAASCTSPPYVAAVRPAGKPVAGVWPFSRSGRRK